MIKHLKSTTLLLLTLGLAACSQSELQSQVPSAVLNKQATGLTATFSTSSTWDGGFNGLITLTNNTTSAVSTWTLNFKFNGNAGLSGTPWGAGGNAVKNADGSYTITPNSWGGNNIPAGGSVTVSYSGTGAFSGVTACTINGQSCAGAPSDTTAPTVSATVSPASLTAAGSVKVTANATDNVGVTKVEFYKGTALVGTDTTAPYEYSESFSSSAQNGSYSYTAKAFDAAGNTKTSAAVTATVNIPGSGDTTPPTASLTVSPANLTASGNINLSATATDNVGVTKVEFYRNGTLINTDTTAPYTYADPFTSGAQNGSYSYTAKSFDAAGNSTTSTAVGATVNLPAPPQPNRIYVGYAGSWNTSLNDLVPANIPSYYTHVNLSFVKPQLAYKKGDYLVNGFSDTNTGLQFVEGAAANPWSPPVKMTPEQAKKLIANIDALQARGTKVYLSVGGWTYSNEQHGWDSFNPSGLIDLAEDLGVDGVDLDWEAPTGACSGDATNFSCPGDTKAINILNNTYSTIQSRGLKFGISIAAWSTGAYYVKGTQWEEGKVQWGSPYGGTMYNLVKKEGSKLSHINLMSYDAGTYFDPRESFESYRAIYSGPIAMGLEPAPEGAGGAVLKLNKEAGVDYGPTWRNFMYDGLNDASKAYNVETLANYIKANGKPGDGMMIWQIWKERVYAPAPSGAAGVNSTGQLVCQILQITSNCSQSVPNLPKL
ncbi:Ig-like domain-containing protein [Deinococcus misasensis]|uniref:Ig-like domain-containing protein n=1 Tax=Deinococcus misasensis TaxID=392413 RepID=UPI000692305D|nr:Ig-like domain-containing protein [Deinococcus misasensis]